MTDIFVNVSGDDPTTDAFWTALGYTAPANKANWSGAETTIAAGYAALGTGGSDVLHIAPGTYSEDVIFNTSTKPNIKVYGAVTIDGSGTKASKSASQLLTIQNTRKTVTGGLGTDSAGKNIDILILDGRTNTSNIIRQQGTGNLTISCDAALYPSQIGAYGHTFARASTDVLDFTVSGRCFILSTEHPDGANPSTSVYDTADTYSANSTCFTVPSGNNNQVQILLNGGIYANCDVDQMFWMNNAVTTPVSKIEIIGGQITGRARYIGKFQNSAWDIASQNQMIMRGVVILPSEWEFGSRVGTATDDLFDLSAGDDYLAENCVLANSAYIDGVDPSGFNVANSKYNSRTFNRHYVKSRRGPVRVSLQTDDFYDTFNYLATQTVDTRVKATMALAYSSDESLVKRLAAQAYDDGNGTQNIASSINENSIPGSTGATTWADVDIQSDFVTPVLAHIANGHELVTHARTHAQLGYADLFDLTATAGTTLDIVVGSDSLTLSGTVTASFTLSDYDEVGDLVDALHATAGVTCNFKTNVNGVSVQVGDVAAEPECLADVSSQSLDAAYDVLRDWTRTYNLEVAGGISDIATISSSFPDVNSIIYPVGHMSDELVAIMEDTSLLGGRQVYALNSGVTVDAVESPYWRPLDEGWEPFRQMCINVESQYIGAGTTKIEVQESVRRYVEWFKWHGGYLNFYGHGLTTMTVGGIVRWDWIIEALKEYVDRGQVVYTTYSQGLQHMRTRNSAASSATGRGGNDRFTYTFTDTYEELDFIAEDDVDITAGGGAYWRPRQA